MSEKKERTSIFATGTEFSADFVGKDEAVYQFNTEIKGKKNVNIPVLVLSYPGDNNVVRIQRREYVRIETGIDISIHDPRGNVPAFTTITKDLSGGGMSIILPIGCKVEGETSLEAWMVLPMSSGEYEYIHVSVESIRVTESSEHRDILSLEFANIKEIDRQAIIRYCFEKQLETRKVDLK